METVKTLKLKNIGNSQGVTFPKEVLKKLNLLSGDELQILVDGNSIVLMKVPTLEELMASVPDGQQFTEADTGTVGIED